MQRRNYVEVGLFPRRMGKTTFLDLLKNFLAVVSDAPYSERRTRYEKLAIYDRHKAFFDEHFGRYTVFKADLKGNKYLERGVLVGVFEARYVDMGSGFNNAHYYRAHTGIANTGETGHPFQRAFGFTGQDVGCLVNHYVDKKWPTCTADDYHVRARFKAHLFAGLLCHFNRYRIGNAACIFCPYAVTEFFQKLGSVRDPKDVHFKGFSSCAESGNLKMINAITADSIGSLTHHINSLAASFHQRHNLQPSIDELVEKHAVDTFDDNVVNTMIHELPMAHPLQDESGTGAEIARMCMVDTFYLEDIMAINTHLSVRTAIQILYQAGFLVPVTEDEVAIPSMEVLQDLLHAFPFSLVAVNATLGKGAI
ncbi:hypothetical protein LPJ61_005167 [Coemansia biformis]|uniref:AAA-ATPase-like domain-containing protein n=1 Tax=Coemansia biformis TaxID=1286918 RepID=A0A9W8CU11_9FUNG|nr:hypothetical protein LPJ61_005167 [Coemansia biformis]